MAQYEARADVARALGHPIRLLMLDALAAGELCVCELTALAKLDQSTVSKHLALLKRVGLVADRREKTKTFYHLNVPCLTGFWQCVETVLQQNLRAQQAACAS